MAQRLKVLMDTGHQTELNWGLLNMWKSPQVCLEVKILGGQKSIIGRYY